ncbi:Na+/H+ antiporter NhaA [Helicobacter jaachi]|uniref:Na(+)/H(+) antiporter NhaA n=1 Tax=Helicobacter jaachi TaxID=1677920 RepID=A0A4U8T8Z3_9HELI|nr:Na+/H+ antiporter NhaA [Helicobacter jaachi]TLD96199.1 Na+/H+ antiporter NhaA [Helicobacter jaachi]
MAETATSGHSYVKDKLQENLNRFITHESFGGILLALCVASAMLTANSSYADLYFGFFHSEFGAFFDDSTLKMSLLEFINDVLMSFFFLLVGLEMKREMLYGELAGFKKVGFSFLAAFGGIVCPVMIYLYFNVGTAYEHGFGVAMSTDTAFALGLIMLLGDRVPKILKIFLVTLAVADDLGAISVIAIFYSENINMQWIYASLVLIALLIYLNYRDTKHLSLYFLVGILLWICVHHSGIHVTIAAVILAMAIPGRTRVNKRYFINMLKEFDKMKVATNDWNDVIATREIEKVGFWKGSFKNIKNFMLGNQDVEKKIDMAKTSQLVHMLDTIGTYSRYAQNPLIRLEIALQPLCAYFFVPLFAFANAGVSLSSGVDISLNSVMLGTTLGLVLGKPIGVLLFCFVGEKLNLATRPKDLSYGHILSVGMISGIGFTMSMFVANLAYKDDTMSIDMSKISILVASSIAALLGILAVYLSTSKQSEQIETLNEEDEIEKLKNTQSVI